MTGHSGPPTPLEGAKPPDSTGPTLQPGTNISWRSKYPWLVYVLPLAVFMAAGSFEPTPTSASEPPGFWHPPYSAYPIVYSLKIVLTILAIGIVWPGIRGCPLRISGWSILVGVVGVVIWVGLWKLGVEQRLLGLLGNPGWLPVGQRSGFNPLVEMADRPALAWTFLGIRLLGLTVVVAVAEELFLRGFLMRFVMQPDWWNVPFGQVNRTSLIVGTVFPMLMHPRGTPASCRVVQPDELADGTHPVAGRLHRCPRPDQSADGTVRACIGRLGADVIRLTSESLPATRTGQFQPVNRSAASDRTSS